MSWAFLTRAKSEQDLVDELGRRHGAVVAAEGVVEAKDRPRGPDGHLTEPAFARQAMRWEARAPADPDRVAAAVLKAMRAHQPRSKTAAAWTWHLQVIAPDSADPLDPRRATAAHLAELVPDRLRARMSNEHRAREVPGEDADRFAQVWVITPDLVWIGLTAGSQVLSRIAGGRTKLKRPADAVSRSGLKLEEAIHWIGVGPDKGDLCADLGAAPGGWTQVAVQRGATVIAVDPAKMKVELPKKRFAHAQQSAFDYAPAETLDWVLCDMAWRPVEVAQLLAKWSRRIWARQLIVNFKLPMKTKAALLQQVLGILDDAGWKGLRARQLFHDRDEVTVFAYLDPGRAHLGMLAPFELRSQVKHDGEAPRKPARPRKSGPRAKARGRGGRKGPRGEGRASGRKAPRGRSRPSGRKGSPRGRGRR